LTLQHFINTFVRDWGYLAVFALMVPESACIPIPSEVTMAAAGWAASRGDLNLFLAALVGGVANLVGSLIAYAVGATGGRAFVNRWGKYVRLNPHHLDRAEAWFGRYGNGAVFWSRLIPVVRTFISLPAGSARMKLGRFSAYSLLGSLIWAFGLALGGYELGNNWNKLASNVEVVSYVVAGLIVLAIIVLIARSRRRRASSAI
jgi:membrane protein DedA with SNARE-associated domain